MDVQNWVHEGQKQGGVDCLRINECEEITYVLEQALT
jgi:hypothetical protein